MNSLLEQATGFADALVALRRDLHRHPELSFREHRTAGLLAEQLRALGFTVRTGVGRTGIVAEIGSGEKIVALRADMDALPIQEASQVDYRSTVAGVMHACGHDAHMAMLMGAARLLAAARPQGRVRLLFQPSEESSDEENKSGAVRMIEDGAMDGVSAVFGIHIGAHLEAGKAYIRPGSYMAGTDMFTATIHGKSAHAARPQEGVDAIVLAAHAILACQNAVARRISPAANAILSIGKIHGGTAENIIADAVSFHGTIRYFEEDVRHLMHASLRAAVNVVEPLGGRGELDIRYGYPPVINDEKATTIARDAVAGVLGEDSIAAYEPLMTAEDFSYLAQKAPGCFFWLGAALDPPREHHNPNFDIDERVLPMGAASLAACAMRFLENNA